MFNRRRKSEDSRCVSVRIAAWLLVQHSKQVMGLPVADARDRQQRVGLSQSPASVLLYVSDRPVPAGPEGPLADCAI
jgi:hypothetical protein